MPPFAAHNSWQKHPNAQFLARIHPSAQSYNLYFSIKDTGTNLASAKLYGYRVSTNANFIQVTEVTAKRECLQVLKHFPSLRLPPLRGSNSKRKLICAIVTQAFREQSYTNHTQR